MWPDDIVETTYKNLRLVIYLFREIINSKIFTHSIEQYAKRDDNVNVRWYKVSVFFRERIDIDEVKSNIDKALIFSRIFKTKGTRLQKTMTQERTTNLFGRVFASTQNDAARCRYRSNGYN